ncbi:MAG: DUF433 domain-containing protein [Nostoc sp. DedQUE08]|uniref:DUF433 domain-containing protein n=1 Tax=unclassified Nostoc TaxID=2593658 RepID=UPI002AD36B7E|nr:MULTISPECIES: DUF433 domain-containing protein [unclassified Nostoc]MDZ8069126.1 DUF433 domain-containing protein [Nostoc sp. DedQUE08]MDZ8090353.1 DUF433 domain-containing protein [Nostoc sp. DedQUE05]
MESQLIQTSPDILSGTPVFYGTRVPVQTLIDYLEAGDRLDDFLEDFPTVSRVQATAFLKLALKKVLSSYESAA